MDRVDSQRLGRAIRVAIDGLQQLARVIAYEQGLEPVRVEHHRLGSERITDDGITDAQLFEAVCTCGYVCQASTSREARDMWARHSVAVSDIQPVPYAEKVHVTADAIEADALPKPAVARNTTPAEPDVTPPPKPEPGDLEPF